MPKKPMVRRATRAELDYIEKYASRSVFDRLAEGQLEFVPPEEIPPELAALMRAKPNGVWVQLSTSDLRRLAALSRKEGIAPEKLLSRWARERLRTHSRQPAGR